MQNVQPQTGSIYNMRDYTILNAPHLKDKSRFFTFCATVIPFDIKSQIESSENVNTKIKI